MSKHTEQIELVLSDALVEVDSVLYFQLDGVYVLRNGVLQHYCARDEWHDSEAVRRRIAELEAELERLRGNNKVACPECGGLFTAGHGLAVHRSRMHGVSGKRTAAPVPASADADGAADEPERRAA